MRIFGHSIRHRFTVTLVSVVGAILLILAGATIYQNVRTIETQLAHQLLNASQLAEKGLPSALWMYNDEFVVEFVDSLFLYEDLVFVRVFSGNEVVEERQRADFRGGDFLFLKRSSQFSVKETVITYEGNPIGKIQIAVTRARIKQAIHYNSMMTVMVMLLIISALVSSIFFISKHYIFIPLATLGRSVSKITEGDFDAPIDTSAEDEIGKLARAFSQMIQSIKSITASRDELNKEIRERKRVEASLQESEAELKRYAEKLEAMVETRTRSLKETQARLVRKERLAAIGQLSGSVAHDLRNPLGVISNSGFFLNQIVDDQANDKIKEHLKIIEREIHRANTIIADLTDISKEHVPVLEKGSLDELLREILVITPLQENIKIEWKLDESLPLVLFDRAKFGRVCQNLINNAQQAMPDGGTIHIRTRQQNQSILLQIEDTGLGITKEHLDHIFEPLFTTKPRGIGLGLSIVQDIVEKHHGKIEVASELGRGTTFSIRLPLPDKS